MVILFSFWNILTKSAHVEWSSSIKLEYLRFYYTNYLNMIDFRVETMFSSSLLPFVGRRAHVLLMSFVFVCA